MSRPILHPEALGAVGEHRHEHLPSTQARSAPCTFRNAHCAEFVDEQDGGGGLDCGDSCRGDGRRAGARRTRRSPPRGPVRLAAKRTAVAQSGGAGRLASRRPPEEVVCRCCERDRVRERGAHTSLSHSLVGATGLARRLDDNGHRVERGRAIRPAAAIRAAYRAAHAAPIRVPVASRRSMLATTPCDRPHEAPRSLTSLVSFVTWLTWRAVVAR